MVDEEHAAVCDYNELHARRAAELISMNGASVLVVGANTGADCRYFIDWGAKEVHGLDVVPNVGCDYQADNVRYFCMSAEAMQLPNNYYDLVYCFATMEHVPDIEAAFKEMTRVTKPGGFIYSVASPLWNSRGGHHMACLSPYPWIHLRMGKQEMINYCKGGGIEGERGLPIESIVSYVLDSKEFNRRPARDYMQAVAVIPNVMIVSNLIYDEPESAVPEDLRTELAQKGISHDELRAVTHEFVAIKRPLTWRQRIVGTAGRVMSVARTQFRRIRRLFE
jgi:SAM-dependent methyltransferase